MALRALVVMRPLDDGFAETLLFQPIDSDRSTISSIAREIRCLLRSIGYRPRAILVSIDTYGPSDPTPVGFGPLHVDVNDPHVPLCRMEIRVGTNGHLFTGSIRLNRNQWRLLRAMVSRVLDSLGLEARITRA